MMTADKDLTARVAEYARLKERTAALNTRTEELAKEIRRKMEEAGEDTLLAGKHTARLSTVIQNRMDIPRLKKDLGDAMLEKYRLPGLQKRLVVR